MKLLIVDGSNIVMRCAFGGDISPEIAVDTATQMVRRAAEEVGATHLVVALDAPGVPSWRRQKEPTYKAHRTVDTTPWLVRAWTVWAGTPNNWWVEAVDGYEADDVIATLAMRFRAQAEVVVLSSDSDLLPLLADGVRVLRPQNGGAFMEATPGGVRAKYGCDPERLPELKAMTGESGDNVKGVEGIGPVRAKRLLEQHATLANIVAAGKRPGADKHAAQVAAQERAAAAALELVTLRRDVPVVETNLDACLLKNN